jgi:hypothetical protein
MWTIGKFAPQEVQDRVPHSLEHRRQLIQNVLACDRKSRPGSASRAQTGQRASRRTVASAAAAHRRRFLLRFTLAPSRRRQALGPPALDELGERLRLCGLGGTPHHDVTGLYSGGQPRRAGC